MYNNKIIYNYKTLIILLLKKGKFINFFYKSFIVILLWKKIHYHIWKLIFFKTFNSIIILNHNYNMHGRIKILNNHKNKIFETYKLVITSRWTTYSFLNSNKWEDIKHYLLQGRTPLHYAACLKDEYNLYKIMINKGAAPSTQDQVWDKKNWVFAINSDFLIPISLQPDIVDLWFFKLWKPPGRAKIVGL